MKWLIFFLLATPIAAQEPKPRIDRIEWSLLAADAGTRALDVYSTRIAIENGGHEILLPSFIADHTSAMAAYSAGIVGVNFLVARALDRRGHRRLAHIVTMIDVGQDAPWAVQNLFIHNAVRHFKAR